jgi:predicted PurR-regulated permease PerM
LFFNQDLADELWKRVEQFIPEKMGSYSALNLNEVFRIAKGNVLKCIVMAVMSAMTMKLVSFRSSFISMMVLKVEKRNSGNWKLYS